MVDGAEGAISRVFIGSSIEVVGEREVYQVCAVPASLAHTWRGYLDGNLFLEGKKAKNASGVTVPSPLNASSC